MTIESNEMSKEYAGEYTSIYLNSRRLIKKPSCVVTFNPIRSTMLIIIVSILAIIVGSLYFIEKGGILLGVLIAVLFVEVIFELRIIFGWKKCFNNVYRPNYHRSATIDENGLSFKDKNREMRCSWDVIKALRIENYGIYFIPKDFSGILLGLDIEHKDEIIEYVKTLNIDLEIVE